MASHRKPRPGGSQPAGVHTPALAAAALTSMAVFSPPAEPALTTGRGVPTPEEIARKIDDFYRQAETALETSIENDGARERRGRGTRGVRAARGGRGERDGWTEGERARVAGGEGSGGRAGRDGGGEGDGWTDGSGRRERDRHADAGGGGPRTGEAGWGPGHGQGAGPGRERRPELAGWAAPAEAAETPRTAEGSLQRLRDEVARRARQRTLPTARGVIPAQLAIAQQGMAQRGMGPARGGTGPGAQGGTDPGQAERGTDEARRGTARVVPGMSQAERRGDRTGAGPSQAEPSIDLTERGTEPIKRGTRGPAAHETGAVPPGSSHVPPGIGHAPPGTGQVSRSAGHVSRSTGEAERATAPAGSPAVIAPPLQATAPPRTMPPMPSMPTMPTAQGAVGVAAPTGSRLEPTVRRPDTTASQPAAPADRPATPAGGPKAAKVVTREKLTYARVLLSQRIARTPSSPSGTYATKAGKAVAFARAQLGKPCVWGAAGPGSYDCAGLTQAAWKSAGVTLPRTAPEQAGVGVPVPPAEARPGDLVFFHDDAGHVGLCTGNGMMIHAPRPGAYVREQPVAALGEGTVHSVVRPG